MRESDRNSSSCGASSASRPSVSIQNGHPVVEPLARATASIQAELARLGVEDPAAACETVLRAIRKAGCVVLPFDDFADQVAAMRSALKHLRDH